MPHPLSTAALETRKKGYPSLSASTPYSTDTILANVDIIYKRTRYAMLSNRPQCKRELYRNGSENNKTNTVAAIQPEKAVTREKDGA
jgi:hypothetical protein